MFKKFFKFITMPFKSDADIVAYGKKHPKAAKVVKVIKGIFTAINAYIDLWSINELLKHFGHGIKKFPDLAKMIGKFAAKFGKFVAVAA